MVTASAGTYLECHSLAKGEHGVGPSLHGICNRPPGETDFAAYSDALLGLGGIWTEERLTAFIAQPEALVPGTSMVWNGLGRTSTTKTLARLFCAP